MKFAFIILAFVSASLLAQEKKFSITDALKQVIDHNPQIQAHEMDILSQRELKKTGISLPKTDVLLMYGQYNSYARRDNNITITQIIPFTAFGSQARVNNALVASSEIQKSVSVNDMIFQTKQAYFQLAYLHERQRLLLQQDSLFEGFFKSSSARYNAGEANLLEKATAEVQRNEAKNKLYQNESDILELRTQLRILMNTTFLPDIESRKLIELNLDVDADSSVLPSNPILALSRQQVEVSNAEKKLESAKAAPDLIVGYFNQTLIGTLNPENGNISGSRNRFSGFQIGVSIPLWFTPYQGRIKSAAYNYESAKRSYEYSEDLLSGQWQQAYLQFEKDKNSLTYYKESALPNAALILKQSESAFKAGEISFMEYLLGVRNVIQIRDSFIATLNDYNQSIILMEYLTGNK
jgi:cobalt-zinc-cadmium resistance protein CzcA